MAYETSAKGSADDNNSRLDFEYGPAKRLVSMYARDKRLEDARKILVELPKRRDNRVEYHLPDGYLEQIRMQRLGSAAGELLKLGFAADAAVLYNESIALAKDIPADSPNYIGNRDGLVRQHRDGLTRGARGAQARRPGGESHPNDRRLRSCDPKKNPDANQTFSADEEGDPLLDLAVLVHPRELDKATVRSLLADTVAAAATGRRPTRRKARDQLRHARGVAEESPRRPLAGDRRELCWPWGRARPRAWSLRWLDWASWWRRPRSSRSERERGPMPAAGQAARQVPLWLVARACWKQKKAAELQPVAQKLATRALEAARRQSENTALLAMLREQGRIGTGAGRPGRGGGRLE